MEIKFVTQPYQADGKIFSLGNKLNELLKSKKVNYNKAWFIASFAKTSGISKLKASMKKAIANGIEINFILGIGNKLTTAEALQEILDLGCNVKIFRNNIGIGIGAKIYIFEADDQEANVFISSGNITEGGLYRNHEMIVHCSYNLADDDDILKYNEFKLSVSNLIEPKEELINELTYDLIGILIDNDEIGSETDKKVTKKKQTQKNTDASEQIEENTQIEDDFLSIELPTGESIEISMSATDDLSKKLEKHLSNNEEIQDLDSESVEEKEETEEEQSELDIVIEGLDNIEININDEVNKRVLEEFCDEEEKTDTKNKIKDDEKNYVTDFEAIDIEQMLYSQNKFEIEDEVDNHKTVTVISEEDMTVIKSKGPKKTDVIKNYDIDKFEETIEEPGKSIVRKRFIVTSNLNKSKNGSLINAFFMQINKLKGRGLSGEIRVPIASRDFSPEFWGWPDCYSVTQKEGKSQKKCKKWITTCRLIDVDNNEATQIDTIELYQEEGKSTFNILSKQLSSFSPEENDIIRVIRCAEGEEAVFQLELIRASSKEYVIWEQFCSLTIKGAERKYGFA